MVNFMVAECVTRLSGTAKAYLAAFFISVWPQLLSFLLKKALTKRKRCSFVVFATKIFFVFSFRVQLPANSVPIS